MSAELFRNNLEPCYRGEEDTELLVLPSAAATFNIEYDNQKHDLGLGQASDASPLLENQQAGLPHGRLFSENLGTPEVGFRTFPRIKTKASNDPPNGKCLCTFFGCIDSVFLHFLRPPHTKSQKILGTNPA